MPHGRSNRESHQPPARDYGDSEKRTCHDRKIPGTGSIKSIKKEGGAPFPPAKDSLSLPPERGPITPPSLSWACLSYTLQQVGSLPRERPSTQGALSLGAWMAAPFRCWTRFLCKGRGTVPSTPQSKEQTTRQKRNGDKATEGPNGPTRGEGPAALPFT